MLCATVGPCARVRREPSQGRKAAALSGLRFVPQIAWPSHRASASRLTVVSDPAAYQSLYRRFRPQRFDELLGQDHVVRALRNAVNNDRVSHAYLFSGPRGTGKTSAARILGKALNCAHMQDGEPDNTCESCVQVAQGSSLDVHELDAASNNGVDAMRELVGRAALGTPGRWKVYIVDEVHMLSTAASNALLKTLEEPPARVVFVLATTDPQKVLPTIRSRTQHFEFKLLGSTELERLVNNAIKSAELNVPDQALDLVIRRGRGSARDTLSALDQIAAAGIVDDECDVMDEITEALIENDSGRALVSVAGAIKQGVTPQRIATDLLEYLRNGFLALMARNLVGLTDDQAERVEDQARRLGAPGVVRSMEVVGEALQSMRDTLEPRVDLEVAVVRLTKPELSADPAALLVRIEQLEKQLAAGVPAPSQAVSTPSRDERPATPEPAAPTHPAPSSSPAPASLGSLRRSGRGSQQTAKQSAPSGGPRPQQAPAAQSATAASENGQTTGPMDVGVVTAAWESSIGPNLAQKARARFKAGRITNVASNTVTFSFPNFAHRTRCEEVQNDVAAAFTQHFGRPVTLVLSDDESHQSTAVAEKQVPNTHDDMVDVADTIAADDAREFSVEERIRAAFPGSEEVK